MLSPLASVKIARDRLAHHLTYTKSVSGFVTDYRVKLSEIVADNLNGDITKGEQVKRHRKLLREYAEDTFVEGMLESGNFDNEADARAEVGQEEQDEIGKWVTEQEGYTAEFAQAVTDARLTDKRTDAENESAQMAVLNRVDLWASALDELGALGRAMGNANKMVTWELGPTEEHCTAGAGKQGCAELAGQRRRFKTWKKQGLLPRQNGNPNITCGGWKCLCRLVDDEGKQVY